MTCHTHSKHLSQPAQDEGAPKISDTTPPHLTERGHSDSAVPSCRLSPDKQQQILSHASTSLVSPAQNGREAAEGFKPSKLSIRLKSKVDFQLPSFQDLGITSPTSRPAALLTPPEEASTLVNPLSASHTTARPQSQSIPQIEMPNTPAEGFDPRLASAQSTQAFTSQQQAITITTPHGHQTVVPAETTPAPTAQEEIPVQPNSISEAIESVVSTALENTPRDVYNVLCHSQPCPLGSGTSSPTTAFNDLMIELQTRTPTRAYIEVTHAVPPTFNMDQVPTSPAVTPNIPSDAQTDYFSLQTTYSKAVIATSYDRAFEFPVPSSPHPVVAPTTIQISLLERYIPPPSQGEYFDLFSNEAPSALVNRLTELTPNKGNLIFIYPTKTGAHTFDSEYLAPLLHPLLRNLAGIHGLMSDLGANIAKLAATDKMHDFQAMNKKLETLLQRLSRTRSSHPAHPPPRYEIVSRTTKEVELDRKSWMTWYVNQEQQRIREIVKNYFRRGRRLPTTEGMTERSICREIFEGLETREYSPGAPSRKGVEVGVWVMRRTA